MLFVSVPYTVNSARLGFEAVDPRLEKVSRTLGHRSVAHAVARHAATGLAQHRDWPDLTSRAAIAEFGAVVILVYYPMTAPVKIYELFIRFGLDEATGMATLLLVVSLAFLIFARFAYGRAEHPGTSDEARGPARSRTLSLTPRRIRVRGLSTLL